MFPIVTAAPTPTTARPTATAPPILQACTHAKYPVAGFTCRYPANQSGGVPEGPPYTIKCIDNSSSESDQPLVSWLWEFGDGKISTAEDPEHVYDKAGVYAINLTVNTWCGRKYSDTYQETLPIYCSVPEPAFTANVTEGLAPLAVQVIDQSVNTPVDITTWTYWFDDSHFSHRRNPVYVYTTPGTYTINQTVWKDCVQFGSRSPAPAALRIIVNSRVPVELDHAPVTTPAATPAGTQPAAMTPTATVPVPVATEVVPVTTAPPATGAIAVSTEPAGAQVWIDGSLRGTSPATIADLTAGSHALRLEREGYQNASFSLLVIGGQTTTFSTPMAPVPGSGIALLPVIALVLIVVSVIGAGIYLYKNQKQE
jgi:hypothetical protein